MAIFIFSRFLEVVSEKAPSQTYLQSFGISHWLMPWVEFKVPVRCLGLYGALSCFLQWDVSVSLFPPSVDQRLLPAPSLTPLLGHKSVWRASAQRLLWRVSPFPLTRTGQACLVHPWALMPPPAVSGAQGLATTVTFSGFWEIPLGPCNSAQLQVHLLWPLLLHHSYGRFFYMKPIWFLQSLLTSFISFFFSYSFQPGSQSCLECMLPWGCNVSFHQPQSLFTADWLHQSL